MHVLNLRHYVTIFTQPQDTSFVVKFIQLFTQFEAQVLHQVANGHAYT